MTSITDTLHEHVHMFVITSRWILLIMGNFSEKCVQKIKTLILCSENCFHKLCRLWGNVDKYCRAGQAADDNTVTVHVLCIPNNWGKNGDPHS